MTTATRHNAYCLSLSLLAFALASVYGAIMPMGASAALQLAAFCGIATMFGAKTYWRLENAEAIRMQAEGDEVKALASKAKRSVYR